MMDDFGPDIFTLLDEEGVEHDFEYLDTAEMDDRDYVALSPLAKNPEEMLEDDAELVILRVDVEENGEEVLTAIEDDDEFDRISVIFMERLSDLFEFDEMDGDEVAEDEIAE